MARPCSSAQPSRTAPVPGWRACGRMLPADAGLVGLVGVPVDEPGVVIGDEDLPLVSGQPAAPLAQRAVRAEVALLAGPAVDVGASVGRVGQRGVHRMVGRLDPGDLGTGCRAGSRPAAAASAGRWARSHSHVARTDPATANWPNTAAMTPVTASSGWKQDLPVGLAPDQADRQAAAQLTAGGLVLDRRRPAGPAARAAQLLMRTSPLCRPGSGSTWRAAATVRNVRHNHSASRNASMSSDGW